ncbi:hypothetical protein CLOP_g22750 [Closterium sp. NIES-67]|nr:hypothetical protein CLOP_g22750 [Closterium sp. NIES-67]
MDSRSLARKGYAAVATPSRDTSAQAQTNATSAQSQNNGDAARVVYQLGLQLLLSGDPGKAARCFQEVSRTFCDWPLLWLRLAECCILAHRQQQQEGEGEEEEERLSRPSSMAVTVMSARNEDTWQYVLLPAGTRGDGLQDMPDSGIFTDRRANGVRTVKSTALDGAGPGESTALSGLADLMERRTGGEGGGRGKQGGAKETAREKGKERKESGSITGSGLPSQESGSGAGGSGLPFSLSLASSLGLDSLPLACMCLKNAVHLLLANPADSSTTSTIIASSSTASGSSSSSQTPFSPPPLSPAAHHRVLLSALCQLAWVELSLLNCLACLTAAQHALSILDSRSSNPPHAPLTPHTTASTPSQAGLLRIYAAEALCHLGRPGEAMSFLSECLVELLEAFPAGSTSGAAGGAGAGGEWRECVYVDLAALHAMKGDVAEARVCAEKAGGGGTGRGAGGGDEAGGGDVTRAGGMASVVLAYLNLKEAVEAGAGGRTGHGDAGVNAGHWEERCDLVLRLLQQSKMVWFKVCSHDRMGA